MAAGRGGDLFDAGRFSRGTLLKLVVVAVVAAGVHLLYELLIHPSAELAMEAVRLAGESVPRTLPVILKDLEQELCLIISVSCVLFIGIDMLKLRRNRTRSRPFLKGASHTVEQVRELHGELEEELNSELDWDSAWLDTLKACLGRYLATGNIQDASDTIRSSIEAAGLRMESDNSFIRYMIWAVPSLGFLGTVRGIGQALSEADEALAGDITSMTASLGVAFNSTMVALFLSIILMIFFHGWQKRQDQELVRIHHYCEAFLSRISK